MRLTRVRLTSTAVMVAGLAVFGWTEIMRAQLARRGGEFTINSVTGGNQRRPQVASLPDGGFAVVWDNEGQVAARFFDAASQPLRAELQVNSKGACFPPAPSLAVAPDRSSLVAWCGVNNTGERFIEGQRFDSTANLEGREFQIGENWYAGPNVAAIGNEQFVVTWTDDNYRGQARIVTSGGEDSPFAVASSGNQYNLAAAGNGDGSYKVVWYDGGGLMQGRSFHGAQPSVDVFEVSNVDSTLHEGPVICTHEDGEFVVSWATYGPDTDVPVMYRKFGANVAPLTTPIPVTPNERSALQFGPVITCGPKPDVAIAWKQVAPNPANTTFRGRIFTPNGPSPFSDFSIGLQDASESGVASMSRLSDGDLLIAWTDCGSDTGCDILGQRFTFAGVTDCPGDCNRNAEITIEELILAVTIALDSKHAALMKTCLPADANLDYHVTIDELVLATGRALGGCR